MRLGGGVQRPIASAIDGNSVMSENGLTDFGYSLCLT